MYRQSDRDVSENIEDIERAVEGLMSQSPAISAALDRVNSTASDISHLSLSPAAEVKSIHMEFKQPRRPPRLTSLHTGSRSPISKPSEPYSPAISRKSSPGIPSGSEISPSEPMDGRSSVGQPSPTLHRPIVMWTKTTPKAPDRRANVAKSLPTLPVTPEVEPGRRRSNSQTESIRLPPPAWQDPANTSTKSETYTVVPQVLPQPVIHQRATSTLSQQDSFEKTIFKNSAIYCDLSVSKFV
jgi:hypothetical protein